MIAERYGRDAVAVKLHPSTEGSQYGDEVTTIRTKIPFELFAGSIGIENKMIIALYSTACFTPKQIFDKEPAVVFLYKLAGLEKGGLINESYFGEAERLKKSYADGEKVVIAETDDDLTAALDKHLKRLDA